MNFITSILAGLGGIFSKSASVACDFWWIDEPKCPKSLIK